jgi:hypothetical protein
MKRIKYFVCTIEALTDLLRAGRQVKCLEGIPPTGRCVGAHFDFQTHMFFVAVEDKSFDEVKPGEMLPEMRVVIQRVEKETDGRQESRSVADR